MHFDLRVDNTGASAVRADRVDSGQLDGEPCRSESAEGDAPVSQRQVRSNDGAGLARRSSWLGGVAAVRPNRLFKLNVPMLTSIGDSPCHLAELASGGVVRGPVRPPLPEDS